MPAIRAPVQRLLRGTLFAKYAARMALNVGLADF
jgi:hypothetical protein